MSVLILVEHDNHRLKASLRALLTAASHFNQPIHVLIAGFQCQGVAKEAAMLPGVAQVWLVDDETFKTPVAEQLTAVVMTICDS